MDDKELERGYWLAYENAQALINEANLLVRVKVAPFSSPCSKAYVSVLPWDLYNRILADMKSFL
jgi:hypothetical protein